jgi:predicted dehydrogenase
MSKPQVLIVGGGMITQVQILPSLYHLQRQGVIDQIGVCALDSSALKVLAEDETLKNAFPNQTFKAYPSLDTDPKEKFP